MSLSKQKTSLSQKCPFSSTPLTLFNNFICGVPMTLVVKELVKVKVNYVPMDTWWYWTQCLQCKPQARACQVYSVNVDGWGRARKIGWTICKMEHGGTKEARLSWCVTKGRARAFSPLFFLSKHKIQSSNRSQEPGQHMNLTLTGVI